MLYIFLLYIYNIFFIIFVFILGGGGGFHWCFLATGGAGGSGGGDTELFPSVRHEHDLGESRYVITPVQQRGRCVRGRGGVFADGEACSRTGRMQTIGTQRSARSYTFLTFRCCSITKSATDRTSFYTLSLYAEELTCTHTQCVCTSLVEIWTRRFAEGGVRETVVFFACAYFHILSIAVFYEPFGASHRPLALVARREERCPTYATD